MANNRQVSTNFWKDNYVVELDPTEKLIFLYLLTNPKTNVAGVYEINFREVSFDTGFEVEMVKRVIARFERDGKVQYENGYILLTNWVKHQSMNPSVKSGIERIIAGLPSWLSDIITKDERTGNLQIERATPVQPVDSLGTKSDILNLTLLNSTLPNLTLLNEATARTDEIEVVEKKVEERVPTKAIDGMFQYWQTTVGYAVTSNIKKNREACGKIYKEYTKDEIVGMIQAAALASEDQYAPSASNFIDLYKNWDRLKLWGKKKGAKQNASAQF